MIQVYSPRQTFIATGLGGPLAGTFMLFQNERSLSHNTAAIAIVVIGLLISLVVIPVVAFYLPEDFPPMMIPMTYGAVAAGFAWYFQVSAEEEQISSSFSFRSNWSAAKCAILGFLVWFPQVIATLYFFEGAIR